MLSNLLTSFEGLRSIYYQMKFKTNRNENEKNNVGDFCFYNSFWL